MYFSACGEGIKWLLTWAPTQYGALPVRGQVSHLWARHRRCGGNFHALLGKHFPGHIFQLHWEAGPTGNQPHPTPTPSNNHPSTHACRHTHTLPHMHSHKQTNLLSPAPHPPPTPPPSSCRTSTLLHAPCLAAQHLPLHSKSSTHKHSSGLGRKGKVC